MESLISKRKALKGQITRIETTISHQPPLQGLQELSNAAVIIYIEKVQKLTDNLDALQEIINTKCTKEEFDIHEAEYNQLITRLESLDILLQNAKSQVSATTTTATIKLPAIDLPKFGGNYIEWFPFHDLFLATVHNNSSLSGAQKLHYLKNSTYGDAALLIQSIQLTDGNYLEAWNILMNRFHNTREIIDAHVKRLFNQPSIKEESAGALRRLVDTTSESIRSLKVLQEPVQHWDSILIYIVKEKLDTESRRQWELSQKGTNRPKYQELTTFLEQRARALSAAPAITVTSRPRDNVHQRKCMTAYHGATKVKCGICTEEHVIYRCPIFTRASVDERWTMVKKHSLCFNCLRPDHQTGDCRAGSCKLCKSKHNTLLHRQQSALRSDVTSCITRGPSLSSCVSTQAQVLLPTAVIEVKDKNGQFKPLRALLDSASQATFITEPGMKRLHLQRTRYNITIGGIGACGIGTSRGSVFLNIKTGVDSFITIQALILKDITTNLPSYSFNPNELSHLKGLKLADPAFYISSRVDVLLGADILFELTEEGKCKGKGRLPTAFKTIFGWAIGGPLEPKESRLPITNIQVHSCSLDEQLSKFWELEELIQKKLLTSDEKECERKFEDTYTRENDGRFMVRLPFKVNPRELGDSKKMAIRRFAYLEKRLQADPKLYVQYRKFMDEYIDMGHMELVKPNQKSKHAYYLPHHAVMKESSTTTKLRVVFDASAKSTSGLSLNDTLLVGPKLQDDLINLLIRFRSFPIVMTADIAKMYRQVLMHPDDSDWQRIVWRRDPSKSLEEYRLLTVTYGTASAPYLATKTLQQLSQDVKERLPLASATLANDFYIDDMMTGVKSRKEGLKLQEEIMLASTEAGFELRKWASNDPAILEALPPGLLEDQGALRIDNDGAIKTLGLFWTPKADHFTFSVTSPEDRTIITKRTILSDTAKVFDPLGLLAPLTILAKLLLQEMWQLKIDWDEPLPPNILRKWQTFRDDLPEIQKLTTPRYISQVNAQKSTLHGFCDASEKAYAAAVYLKTVSLNGEVYTQLIVAKTRVAPLKKTSLPRLELCGAVLLTKLIVLVQRSINEQYSEVHCWTDSTIVLAWIMSPPQRWKTFVANRTSEIQEALPTAHWHHVSGETNPADCASRGVYANELRQHELWWHGPKWLNKHEELDDNSAIAEPKECSIEEKKTIEVITHHCQVDNSILENYSSLRTLINVTAYILRFICNVRTPKKDNDSRRIGSLTAREREAALLHLVRQVQQEVFFEEYTRLSQKKDLSSKSQLLPLHPFLDHQGIIRVGGRLQHARISPDKIHPMLLPRKNKLTDLIIIDEHVKHLHGGTQLLITVMQRRYWVIGQRDAVRFQVRRCVRCVRQQAITAKQLMGALPASRVNPARPFLNCGVDYAGPFIVQTRTGRGQKSFKAYVALFACFTTRALHLEVVSDMSTEAFLAALKRFVARRGKCANIYSDCGSNFIGADRELKDFFKFTSTASSNSKVVKWSTEEGITWHFNPPAAPHFGGLWEAGVKSVKFHLKRVIGATRVTYEEFQTLLCQIEACLNSRPLTALSSDPNDLAALTPGHFLIGGPLTAIPEHDLTSEKITRLSRWQVCQNMLQHFWKRWSNEYLARLQQRPKWATPKPNLKIGDLVLLKDETMPPTKWKMGRIVQVHPGADEYVRVATIKTADREVKRPVAKLCQLPLET